MRKLANRELDFLRYLGAEPTINSGATFSDADGKIELLYPLGRYQNKRIIVEIKSTDKKSFSIRQTVLNKLLKEAREQNGLPILGIDINGSKYVLIDAAHFTDIIGDYIGDKYLYG